jgi:hypothetical protein
MEEAGYDAPTRENIIVAIRWLVEGQRAGDRLFFAFAGALTCLLFRHIDVHFRGRCGVGRPLTIVMSSLYCVGLDG